MPEPTPQQIIDARARLERLTHQRETGARHSSRRRGYPGMTQEQFDRLFVEEMEHASIAGVRATDLRILLDAYTVLKIFRDFVLRHTTRMDVGMIELCSMIAHHPATKDDPEARIAQEESDRDRYLNALIRLGSMNAFESARATRRPDDDELLARIAYAREVAGLEPTPEEKIAPLPPIAERALQLLSEVPTLTVDVTVSKALGDDAVLAYVEKFTAWAPKVRALIDEVAPALRLKQEKERANAG